MRLPHLSPTAKAQLWGLIVGGATAFYATYKLGLSLGLFVVGAAAAWAAGEALFGKRLIGTSDAKAITLAVVSGLAFPWLGFVVALLIQMARN